jgi:lipoprotein-anchoring transpeptidase ErfK/SrfK
MNISKFFRAALLGIAASVAIPAAADAVPMRFFDPTENRWVEYSFEETQDATPDEQFQRQIVEFATTEAPGTIVIDTANKFLHFVLEDGMAIRYGVGVGREGFGWSGEVEIGAMAEWPTWTPPAAMIERRPELIAYVDGMPGGEDNPLGARAMYLYDDGADTMYRIHGTNEPWSIGGNVSSAC